MWLRTKVRREHPTKGEGGRTMKEHSKVEKLMWLGSLAALCAVGACAAGPLGGNAEDHVITARIQALLEQHAALQAPNLVTVQTIKHVVYLKGLVGTPYQRELAQSVVAQADEGLRVVNMIAVENSR
jgi:osmotically-inducible protein OsmY